MIPESYCVPQTVTVTSTTTNGTTTYTSDTTFEEIQNMINAGVFVQVEYDGFYYQLYRTDSSRVTFQTANGEVLVFLSDGTINDIEK